MSIYVYDVEVLRGPDEIPGGWNDPEGMGFGTAVVYDYAAGLYHFFGPGEKQELEEVMPNESRLQDNTCRLEGS